MFLTVLLLTALLLVTVPIVVQGAYRDLHKPWQWLLPAGICLYTVAGLIVENRNLNFTIMCAAGVSFYLTKTHVLEAEPKRRAGWTVMKQSVSTGLWLVAVGISFVGSCFNDPPVAALAALAFVALVMVVWMYLYFIAITDDVARRYPQDGTQSTWLKLGGKIQERFHENRG